MGQGPGLEPEEVDSASDESTAAYLVGEYRMAFGPGWSIWAVDKRRPAAGSGRERRCWGVDGEGFVRSGRPRGMGRRGPST
jgi:hypothetical protein